MGKDEDSAFTFKPEEIHPVDPMQFAFALQLGSAAMTYRMPMKSPATEGVAVVSKDGTVHRYTLVDRPANRLMIAIRDHFAPDDKTYMSVMMRYSALQRLWKNERMKKWVRKDEQDPEKMEVHEAVFIAGATLPLNAEGCFEEDAFFNRLEEIAKAVDEPNSGPPVPGR